MSYRSALLRRWSTRDVLAVLVVAVSVAFLTGAGLVGTAATAELAGVAEEFESPASVESFDDPGRASEAAGRADVVLPLARATVDGREVTVVGIPPEADGFGADSELSLPGRPPEGEVRGPVDQQATLAFEGRSTGLEATVRAHAGSSSLPDRWYVARAATVRELGSTGALVLSPGDGPTPVVGVLSFFLAGSRQVLRSLWLATGGAGLLLGVTVFAATRMTVRDRLDTLRVARATGARPRDLLGLFGARAALQTAVGVAGGYAVGVVAPNAAVNAAVFLGQETSLSLRVTPELARLLVPAYALLVGVGALGGVLATLPAVRRPPASLGGLAGGASDRRWLPGFARTELLDWRAVVPTAASLSVFVVVVVLVASTVAVVAPLAGDGGTTITQPGAAHPFASSVPEGYATGLRVQGTDASAEILALGVTGGHPFVARGANFSAFAGVTDAEVSEGRQPERAGEAVVGVDLVRTLGLSVGDQLLVGGSTRPAVDRLRVVGTYRAPEPYDDQLVVPLSTARELSGGAAGRVQFVRTAEELDAPATGGSRVMADVDAPGSVRAGTTLSVTVGLVNPTERTRTRTVEATFGGDQRRRSVELEPGARTTVRLEFPAGEPRTGTLRVAGTTRTVEVVDPDALRIRGLPGTAPAGGEPRLQVVTVAGDPVGNVTVRVGERTVTTEPDGTARLPPLDAGTREVVASAGERGVNATVDVDEGAPRLPAVELSVDPPDPTPATRPTVRASVANPWNETLAVPLVVEGPRGTHQRSVELRPGETVTESVQLARIAPGEYQVSVTTDGARLAGTTYRVTGDARLAAALATGGRDGATGIGQSLAIVLGNLELLVATVLGLAAMMTVGGTTAGFASAVQTRRRTLGVHRAMGATPRQVLTLVLADAARIGTAATLLGVVLAGVVLGVLDAAGLLTVYGVRVLSTVDPLVVAGSAAGALGLAVLGATLATVPLVRAMPGRLLAGSLRAPGGDDPE